MTSRLFHSIIVCGAALGAVASGCGPADEADDSSGNASAAGGPSTDPDDLHERRCRLEDGSCHEHCSTLASGACVDPCFVHTTTCSPNCLLPDGSCGWPPTK